MGGKVPRRLVSAGDALPHRAHEEDRPVTARASRTDPQLFPRSEAALQRGCRGPEQQSQTHNEKILRIPHHPLSRTRPLSLTCQITGAGINPRFFLTNHNTWSVRLETALRPRGKTSWSQVPRARSRLNWTMSSFGYSPMLSELT